jgi:hypothetical protein
MGWCSGTEIFDVVCEGLLANGADEPKTTKEILKELMVTLEDKDWDCQGESSFYNHRLIQEIMRELHPTWFDEA